MKTKLTCTCGASLEWEEMVDPRVYADFRMRHAHCKPQDVILDFPACIGCRRYPGCVKLQPGAVLELNSDGKGMCFERYT